MQSSFAMTRNDYDIGTNNDKDYKVQAQYG
jgi:hypothetical protein